MNRPVFAVSAALASLFIVLSALFPRRAARAVAWVQDGILSDFGWFYILAVALLLLFVVVLLFSPYGRIRLGHDGDEPEYSYPTWFAMLFSAGMGIGLLFYGVAEPVQHFVAPLGAAGGTVEAAKAAFVTTLFHWGLHAWGIYVVVGLALAYFAYRHDLPLTIRSTLLPLLGDRIHGPLGHAADTLAVLGTLFGLATSLGFGALQANAGLAYLGVADNGLPQQLALIGLITLAATASVASGLDRGVRRLSELNLLLALLLLLFVFIVGPSVFLLSTFVEGVGNYLSQIVGLSFRTTAFRGVEWQKSWTMFYWGWWVSWAPFVGMFIARISRGRTLREFVAGVLFVPALFNALWFTVFGNTALHSELFGPGGIAEVVARDMPAALFTLLDQLPWAGLTTALATVLVVTFFITSADSGALVIDILAHGGDPTPPLWSRIFWALSAGGVAAVLLVAGGLQALQTAAIVMALPFLLIMIAMAASLLRALRADPGQDQAESGPALVPAADFALPVSEDAGPGDDWRARLAEVVGRPGRAREGAASPRERTRRELRDFIAATAVPAFAQIQGELARHGRRVAVDRHPYHVRVAVLSGDGREFVYTLRARADAYGAFRMADAADGAGRQEPSRAEVVLVGGVRKSLPLSHCTRERLIGDFIAEYAKWLGW
ncbi:BCCT family transporter [Oryzomicrobium sp.]|uniref:BCCT family transporter n=1 Tax=Oryzomicrobium sp. TaxID=1911578 RepID=UPI002FE10CE1